MAANNEAAPNVMRLNLARGTREEIVARMTADGIGIAPATAFPKPHVLESAADFDSDSYRAGLFHPQSEASQLVARMLAPSAGATVVDCAAAPGGKTTHLAELADARGRVVALDLNLRGLKAARDLARRLGHRNIVFAPRTLPLRCRCVPNPRTSCCSTRRVPARARCGSIRRYDGAWWRTTLRRMAELQRADAGECCRAGSAGRCDRVRRMQRGAAGRVGRRARLSRAASGVCDRTAAGGATRALASKRRDDVRPVLSAAASTAFSPPGCAGDEPAFCRPAAESVVFAHGTRAQDCAVDPVGRLRAAGRGNSPSRGGRRRSDSFRRDGRPFRAESLDRHAGAEIPAQDNAAAARRASDDLEARALSAAPSSRPAPIRSRCTPRCATTCRESPRGSTNWARVPRSRSTRRRRSIGYSRRPSTST